MSENNKSPLCFNPFAQGAPHPFAAVLKISKLPSPPPTGEEQLNIADIYQRLDRTATELGLSEEQKAERLKLHKEVVSLRPADRLEKHRAAQGRACQWLKNNPDDPLANEFIESAESSLEEAELWREIFPDFEEKVLEWRRDRE